MENFHERLAYVQQKFNLTEKNLTDFTGYSQSAVNRIRKGDQEPPLKFVINLCDSVPSISLDWLLMNKGIPFPSDEERTLGVMIKHTNPHVMLWWLRMELERVEKIKEVILEMIEHTKKAEAIN
ncbi:MAG: helix-turn-helix transcriptional regulator [Bacteroidota bacterium]